MTISTAAPLTSVNVRTQHGARGDGSTDDLAAFQSAIAKMATATRGEIEVPAGTYLVSASLLPTANIVFRGAGRDRTIIKVKDGSAAFNVFQIGNVNGVGFSDLTIDLNKANSSGGGSTSGIGIYWAPTSGNTGGHFAQRVKVVNGRGIGIRWTSQAAVTDATSLLKATIHLTDVEVTDCLLQGIVLLGATDSRVDRAIVRSNGEDGISVLMARNTVINQAVTEDNGANGIVMQYINGGGVFASDARRNANSGIAFGGGNVGYIPNLNYRVCGCLSEANTQHGFTNDPTIVSGELKATSAVYTGNIARSNTLHGFYFQCVDQFTLSGNESASNAGSGVAAQARRGVISGNYIHDNGAYGIDLQASSGTTPTPGAITIGLNQLHDNTSGDLTIDSHYANVSGATGSKTHDWADLASGAEQTTTVTCTGATLGMAADASMSISLAGTKLFAYVSAADTVTVIQRNDTGGNVNLASGTLRVTTRRIA